MARSYRYRAMNAYAAMQKAGGAVPAGAVPSDDILLEVSSDQILLETSTTDADGVIILEG